MKLAGLLETTPPPPSSGGLNITYLDRAVTAIEKRYGVVDKVVSQKDLDSLINSFRHRLDVDDWSKFSWGKANTLFRGFFASEHSSDPDYDEIKDTLIATLEETHKRSYIKAAVDTFLQEFDTKAAHQIGEALEKKPRQELPGRLPILDQFDLFGDPDVAQRIGHEMALQSDAFTYLKELGIRSPHQKGLAAVCFGEMLKALERNLLSFDRKAYDNVIRFLKPKDGNLYEIGRARAVDALLEPFAKKTSGDDDIRVRLERLLVDEFGDPRVSPGKWAGVSEQSLKLVQQWLTTKSLEVFFEIISKSNNSHMWAPRKKFWTEMNKLGVIDNAWVILNSSGVDKAKALALERDDMSFLAHGRIDGYGEDKCYFIVQMGGLIAVEGTDNFSIKFFRRENKNRPVINKKQYQTREFAKYNSDKAIPHDASGGWTSTAYEYIRRNR